MNGVYKVTATWSRSSAEGITINGQPVLVGDRVLVTHLYPPMTKYEYLRFLGECCVGLLFVCLTLVMMPFGLLGRKIPRFIFSEWVADLIEIPFLPILWVCGKVSRWMIKTSKRFTVTDKLLDRWDQRRKTP